MMVRVVPRLGFTIYLSIYLPIYLSSDLSIGLSICLSMSGTSLVNQLPETLKEAALALDRRGQQVVVLLYVVCPGCALDLATQARSKQRPTAWLVASAKRCWPNQIQLMTCIYS